MSTPLARRMTFDILRRCLDHHQDLQAAVDDVLSAAAQGPDRGLATELAYGYLRYRGRIDFLLNQLLKNPVQTSPVLKRILGVAAYELLFLNRIPEYATLDWSVNLVRERLDQTMSKLANAILRNLIRLGRAAHQADYFRTKTAGHAQFLAAWYSSPAWLVQLWLQSYGKELTEEFLRASISAPPQGVRINPAHPEAPLLRERLLPLATQSSAWGVALSQWPEFLNEAIRAGQATRQSMAAQDIMHSLSASRWPGPILDACAGRGGKTFLLGEMGKDIWASDINVFRLIQLRQESRRLHIPVTLFRAPGQGPYPLKQRPRTILLDAPCSGLGVVSRRPDIKWKRTPNDCAGLVSLQADLLDGAAGLLAPGGFMVYVTCTMNREENETQIKNFVRKHPEFSCLKESRTDPDNGLNEFFYGAILRKLEARPD